MTTPDLTIAFAQNELNYIPQTCLTCPCAEVQTARRPDIVVLGKLQGEEYEKRQYRLGEAISSKLLPSLQLRLDDILPR
jgi:DUF971 family protein